MCRPRLIQKPYNIMHRKVLYSADTLRFERYEFRTKYHLNFIFDQYICHFLKKKREFRV